MKILMLGWEFPPYSTGGLGTACHGLTKALAEKDVEITFVMPNGPDSAQAKHVNLIVANNFIKQKVKFKKVNSILTPYITSEDYDEKLLRYHKKSGKEDSIYGRDLYDEVNRFTEKVKIIARDEDFDVIHAHDWMTYKAGIAVSKESGKPLVAQIHATEFDRTGGNPNQYVYDIEKEGMNAADRVIAVSNFTKNKVTTHYGVDNKKIRVVHNAVEHDHRLRSGIKSNRSSKHKTVLFLGRITLQKGPDYFLYAAKKVLEKVNNVRFVIAGTGDMEPHIIEKAAELGMANKVLFTGFLAGKDVDKAYQLADLYVMPSVSEPFGITPLEAIRNDVPVLISKQSGVSEVLKNCLKTDFWDIDDMANKMIATLKYNALSDTLRENANEELQEFNWGVPAGKCIDVYNEVLGT
ncbi:glycosyltransferase family 4 protein [Candidatus Woesearchaeota archaeon]|nr:glycosyltransferase family 4 protein [Candidatus Woesearchaeota archaeon]